MAETNAATEGNALGRLKAEIGRQCSLGAGNFYECSESGLWEVVANLDPNGLATALATTTLGNIGAEVHFVAGPVWREAEEEGECWTAEVQVVGGYYVVATVHGSSEHEARRLQAAIIAVLAS